MKKTTLFAVFSASFMLTNLFAQIPTFSWAKQLEGPQEELINSVAIDADGNLLATGYFTDTVDFDPGSGVFNLISNGGSDIFIIKLDSNGNFIWAKQMGGIEDDVAKSISIDENKNIYTTGYFKETVDFDPNSDTSMLTCSGDGENIFIQKLDPNGNLIWVKQIGNDKYNIANDIELDTDNNILVTGSITNTVDLDPGAGVYNLTSQNSAANNNSRVFILKLDLNGDFVWAKQNEGIVLESLLSIDHRNNIVISGIYKGTVDFDPGVDTFNLSSNNTFDVFTQKLNAEGNLVWASSTAGSTIRSLATATGIDNSVYTAGFYTGTTDFDPTTATFNLSSNGRNDIFIQKLDSNANLVWAKSIGGSGNDQISSLTTDKIGNLLITGRFMSTVDFDPNGGSYNITSNGQVDAFILKIDNNGNFIWVKHMGGSSADAGNSIAIDKDNVYTVGHFYNIVDFDTEAAVFELSSKGLYDGFIQKLSVCQSVIDVSTTVNNLTITANNTNATYQWFICDSVVSPIPGATNQSFTATTNGRYMVQIREDGCIDTSLCIEVPVVGLLENSFTENFVVYPNPTKGELSISFEKSFNQLYLRILTISGQEVERESFVNKQDIEINLNQPNGVYLLEIVNQSGKKAIIQIVKE